MCDSWGLTGRVTVVGTHGSCVRCVKARRITQSSYKLDIVTFNGNGRSDRAFLHFATRRVRPYISLLVPCVPTPGYTSDYSDTSDSSDKKDLARGPTHRSRRSEGLQPRTTDGKADVVECRPLVGRTRRSLQSQSERSYYRTLQFFFSEIVTSAGLHLFLSLFSGELSTSKIAPLLFLLRLGRLFSSLFIALPLIRLLSQ